MTEEDETFSRYLDLVSRRMINGELTVSVSDHFPSFIRWFIAHQPSTGTDQGPRTILPSIGQTLRVRVLRRAGTRGRTIETYIVGVFAQDSQRPICAVKMEVGAPPPPASSYEVKCA